MIADVDVGDLKAAVLMDEHEHGLRPSIRAKAPLYSPFGLTFLEKIFVHSFHFVLSLSFAVRFSLTKTHFPIFSLSHYPGWPSA